MWDFLIKALTITSICAADFISSYFLEDKIGPCK